MKIADFFSVILLLVNYANGAYSAQSAIGIGVDTRQNFFNIELLQGLNEIESGNTIVGTSSVKACLMLLIEAAQGRSRQELLTTLRLPPNLSEIRNTAKQALTPYADPSGSVELITAAKLWASTDSPINKNYSATLQRYYNSDAETVNFKDVKNTLTLINNWVKTNTKGFIDSLYSSGDDLDPETKMVLTTAVYFKGKWMHSFDKEATRVLCFNTANNGCVKANMMENIANYKFGYIPAFDAEAVQIPYTGGNYAMVIMLPKRKDPLALDGLSRNLAFVPMSIILNNLQETEVKLQIPRFAINTEIDLSTILQRLGVRDLFNSNANLSGAFVSNKTSIGNRVSSVIHKARIEVAEEGTIAAAVTGTSVVPLMGGSYTDFTANRPFLYFLVNANSGEILFAGRITDPSKSQIKS